MTLDELLQKRRSVRKYREMLVPLEILLELKEAAKFAPSAGAKRPVSVYLVGTILEQEAIPLLPVE